MLTKAIQEIVQQLKAQNWVYTKFFLLNKILKIDKTILCVFTKIKSI